MLTLFLRSILIFSVALFPFKGTAEQPEIRKSELPLPAHPSSYQYIRVLILEKAPSFRIAIPQSYQIFDAADKPLLQGAQIIDMNIARQGNLIYLGAHGFDTPYVRIQTSGLIKVKDKGYADTIVILPNPAAGLDVVNEVGLEKYLKGVLPKEVLPGWPPETLKAQAIVSRTYAFFRMLEKADETYDVASDVTSQVFGGAESHDPRTDAAVDATRGMVLTYRGKIFPAFFHSNSGGFTTRAETVWDIEPHPVLKGVASELSLKEKNAAWHGDFTYAEIEKALIKYGVKVQGVYKIKFKNQDNSGRYVDVEISDKKGRLDMRASEFRMALDPFRFRSTLITSVAESSTGITVRGRGWGHGVGLCQYGSRHLGSLGYTYKDILNFYYPLTNITYLDI